MSKKDKMMGYIERIAKANNHSLREWVKGRWGFNTNCCRCGAYVAITVSTGDIREGELLLEPCRP